MARNVATTRTVASARVKIVPQSLYFDGTPGYVATANDIFSQADFAGGLTLEAWVKAETLTDVLRQIVTIEGRGGLLGLVATTDLVQFNIYDGAAQNAYSDAVLIPNVWYHLAGVWGGGTGGTMTVYINGVAQSVTDTANVGTIDAVARPTVFGADYTFGSRFNGWATEFRIWNKPLAVADLLIHVNDPQDITCVNTATCSYASNCLLHYPTLEGTGTTTADASGHGFTGTFRGAGEPAWSTDTPNMRTAAAARGAVV